MSRMNQIDEPSKLEAAASTVTISQTEYDRLVTAAYADQLTRLPNRNAFDQYAKHGAWLVLADLNKFKQVNDTYGHETGDNVLKSFAAHIDSQHGVIRWFRLGGDEFVGVVLEPTTLAKIKRHVSNWEWTHGGVECTASFGVGRTLADADAAMYQAKPKSSRKSDEDTTRDRRRNRAAAVRRYRAIRRFL